MIYSLSTTKLGPFGLLWVGLYTFMMAASDGKNLDEGVNMFFMFFYFVANVGLVLFHITFAKDVHTWAKKTPLPSAAASTSEAVAADSEGEI